jgi:hypothetical protein
MKRAVVAFALACASAPAHAQTADADLNALLQRWVAGFNKGDAAALARDVYEAADVEALNRSFQDLRADSFGKLEVYEFKSCPPTADKAKVQMSYARIYTFGGKMNEDESKVFDLTRTPAGWRISSETDTEFGKALAC